VQGIAFDASGTLWASLKGATSSVVSYAAAGLADSAPLTPGVTLSDSNISDPAGLAFGPNGQLWVANCATNSITAYPRAGGSAIIVITSPSGMLLKCPRAIAFDTVGNLWVANATGVAERFPNAQIAATNNAPAADVTLTAPASPASSQPSGIALDASGNVWVAFCSGSTVARYAASGTTVNTTPAATLTPTGASPVSLDCPVALALDNSGQLWVANKGTGIAGATLSEFALTDMASGGPVAPLTELTVGVTVGGLAFNPTATNLPIRH
jgi:streptogramin lyase